MGLIAAIVGVVGVLLAYVGRRFERTADAAAQEGVPDAEEAERLYRTQARLLYVIAGAALLLALSALAAAFA